MSGADNANILSREFIWLLLENIDHNLIIGKDILVYEASKYLTLDDILNNMEILGIPVVIRNYTSTFGGIGVAMHTEIKS